MNKVTVISKRTGVRLTCKQEILKIEEPTPNIIELERRITLERRRIAT